MIRVTSVPEQSKSTKLTLSPERRVDASIKIEKTPDAKARKPRVVAATPTEIQNKKSPLLAMNAPGIRSPYGQEKRAGKKTKVNELTNEYKHHRNK